MDKSSALDTTFNQVPLVTTGDAVDTNTPGTYTIIYNAQDLAGNAAEQVTRTVIVEAADAAANIAPVANAGADQPSVTAGATVTLDGSDSSDSDGTIQSYAWEHTSTSGATSPMAVTVANGETSTFTAPATAAILVFTLTVTDDDAARDTDTVTITVTEPEGPGPLAEFDEDTLVDQAVGATGRVDLIFSDPVSNSPINVNGLAIADFSDSTGVVVFNIGSPSPTGTYPIFFISTSTIFTLTLAADSVTGTRGNPGPAEPVSIVGTPRNVAPSGRELSALTISQGTLDPAFTRGNEDYTAEVGNTVTSVTFTPTTTEATATVTVDGDAVTSGTPSAPVALTVGENAIDIVVDDGSTFKKRYTVVVTRAATVSTDANLAALTLSAGTLDPVFAADTTAYTVSVDSDVASVMVTPTVNAAVTASVSVAGTDVTSGTPSAAIPLMVGANNIDITVTAEDASTKTYTVTITRAADIIAPTVTAFDPVVGARTLDNATEMHDITFSEAVTGLEVGDFATSTGATVTEVSDTDSDQTTYTLTFTPTEAAFTLTLAADSVADLAGLTGPANDVSASGTAQVALAFEGDPVLASSNAGNYAIVGNILTLTFSVNLPLESDPTVTIAGQSATVVKGDGNSYTATWTVTEAVAAANDGNLVVYSITGLVAAGSTSNTLSLGDTDSAIRFDTTAPTVTAFDPVVGERILDNATEMHDITFSEPVTGSGGDALGVDDFTATGATITDVTSSDQTTHTITFTPTETAFSLTLAANSVADLAGLTAPANDVTASGTAQVVLAFEGDHVLTSNNPGNHAIVGNILTLTFTVNQALASDPTVTIAGQSATVVKGDGNTYTATQPVTESLARGKDGAFVMYSITGLVAAGSTSDTLSLGDTESAIRFDLTAPSPTFGDIAAGVIGTAQDHDITFNEAVTALTDTDFATSIGATVSSVALNTDPSAEPNTYTITFTPSATEFTITLAANAVSDLAGLTGPATAASASGSATQPTATTADLSSLTTTAGDLSPAFNVAVTNYNVSVLNGVTSTTITPTAVTGATVTVAGTAVTSGTPSGDIPLTVGANALDIVVTAADGTTEKTYTVTVRRAPLPVTLTLAADTGSPTDRITSNGQVNVTDLATNAIWRYTINGGSTFTPGTGTSFTLPEGVYAAGADDEDIQVVQSVSGVDSAPASLAAVTVDTTAPVITLENDTVAGNTGVVGTAYTDPGYTATDNVDTSVDVDLGGDTLDINTAAGTYLITYDATDTAGNGAVQVERTVTVTEPVVTNQPPVANAGADQSATTGTQVTLTGSGSSDSDGTIQSYAWTHTSTDGGAPSPLITLSGATTDTATFTPDTAAVLVFTLTVTDDSGATNSDTVTITVVPVVANIAPIANAGGDQSATTGTEVTLTGAGSSDSDGTIQSYEWVHTSTDGSAPSTPIIVANGETSTFTAPDTAAELVFTLTVTDDSGDSATNTGEDTVTITVVPVVANIAPTANAGGDQSATTGTEVTLTGAGSSDSDGTIQSYEWVHTSTDGSAPSTPIIVANGETSTFTAPDTAAELVFTLTVTDDAGASHSDTVTITVTAPVAANQPPVAEAGDPQSVTTGTEVTLSGTGSSDPENGALTYSWAQTSGTDVTLINADTATATFTAPNTAAVLIFTLLVADDADTPASDTDTVTITVTAPDTTKPTVTEFKLPDDIVIDTPDTTTITFSEPVTGLLSSDFSTTGATVTNVAPAAEPNTYTITFTPDAAAFTLTLAANSVDDLAGNPGPASAVSVTTTDSAAAEVILSEIARAIADQNISAIVGRVERARTQPNGTGFNFAGQQMLLAGNANANGGGANGGNSMSSTLDGMITTHAQALADDTLDMKTLLGNSDFSIVIPAQSGIQSGYEPGLVGNETGISLISPISQTNYATAPIPGTLTLWGSGDYRNLSGEDKEQTLDWDGDLFSLHLGVDAHITTEVIGGVALSWSEGEMDTNKDNIKATYDTSMTSINPYFGWSDEYGEVWMTAGYGKGELERDIDGTGTTFTNDLSMQTFAIGGNSILLQRGADTLRLKGEISQSVLEVDANQDRSGLPEMEVDANRARLSLETTNTVTWGNGARTDRKVELGARHDGGDGITGTGIELGLGLRHVSATGLSIEGKLRGLLGHEGDINEWGISGTIKQSAGADGQGFSFALSPGYGDDSSDLQRLWEHGLRDVDGNASNDPDGNASDAADPDGNADPDYTARTRAYSARLDARIGYGVNGFTAPSWLGSSWLGSGIGLLTPYTALTLSDSGNRYRLGVQWELGDHLDFDLLGEHQDADDDDNTILLKGVFRF